MKKLFLFAIAISSVMAVLAQNVAITDDNGYTAHSSAMLDVKSTTKGMLVPRLTTTQRTSMTDPAEGLLVFDTDQENFCFYNGTEWVSLTSGTNSIWSKSGSNVFLSSVGDKVGVGTSAPIGKLGVLGDVPVDSDAPLFEVVNSNGDTVFAVYSQGVRINVYDDPSVKTAGSKAGFAVGGYSLSKEPTNEFLRVTPDSVRIYIDEDYTSTKASGSKGGFAVGGFSLSKGLTDNYLFVQDDSTRVYVNGDAGFSVGDIQSGSSVDYLDLNPVNYFIGHQSGDFITTGQYNSFIGYQSGMKNTAGNNNVFLGYQAGQDNTLGEYNVFLGYRAGMHNIGNGAYEGAYNVFIGDECGQANKIGQSDVYIGHQAGRIDTSGRYNVNIGRSCASHIKDANFNVFLGAQCAESKNTGDNNVFIGSQSGAVNEAGTDNVFIGSRAGNNFYGHSTGSYFNQLSRNVVIGSSAAYYGIGSNNVVIGDHAGHNMDTVTSCGNVFIGYRAGYNEYGSDKLYIENSWSSTPLIYGDFTSDYVYVNGNFKATGIIYDSGGDAGTNGQVLTSYGTLTNWETPSGDISDVTAGNGLTGGASSGNATINVGAGDGIDIASDAVSVDVTDIAGNGLTEDGSNNLIVGAGDGIDISATSVAVDVTDFAGNGLAEDGSNNLVVGAGDGIDVSATSVAVDVTDILGTGLTEDGSNNVLVYGLSASDGSPTNVLYVDADGEVGIGTSSPTAPLDLECNSSGYALQIEETGAGTENWQIGTDASGNLIFYDETVASVMFEDNGDVGIGTTSPDCKLHVIDNLASNDDPAVYGEHAVTDFYGIGVKGVGKYMGVIGEASTASSNAFGVHGTSTASGSANAYGVYGIASGTGTGTRYGIYGAASGGTTNWAGYFQGNVHVNGTLSKNAGTFRIDHPLDPENKYLSHSFVESPDMKNVYDGTVILDAQGKATVTLPNYFEILNKDFRYQLTPIGVYAPLFIEQEITNNQFVIAGGQPGMKVSWMVTGIRQDPYAQQHPVIVEENKAPQDKGKYLNPELYGQPVEKAMHLSTVEK